MSADEDDAAALAWAGDEKPVVERVETPAEQPVVERVETPAALLVTYGILAGAYLLYTVGWVASVQRYNASFVVSSEPLNAFMFGLGQILAMAAPALWFGAALVLTRGRKPIIRLLALVVGLALVVPWPFALGVWQ